MEEKVLIGSTLVVKDDKFLLVKAKVGAPKGMWNNPGGHLEEGESVEDGSIRETKEETGFDVELLRLVGRYVRHVDKHVFEAKIVGGEMDLPEDEIEEAKWFSYDEVLKLEEITFGARQSVIDYHEGNFDSYHETEELP